MKLKSSNEKVNSLIERAVILFLKEEESSNSEIAKNLLNEALVIEPENTDALFWQAKCLYHIDSNYELAQHILEKALKIDPDRAECLSLYVSVLNTLDISFDKILLLNRALASEPEWPSLHELLASEYLKQGKQELAKKEVLIALDYRDLDFKTYNEVEEYYECCVTGRKFLVLPPTLERLVSHNML